jgi:hypothetical protein
MKKYGLFLSHLFLLPMHFFLLRTPTSRNVVVLLLYRWWFPTKSEQYRIRGKLIFVGNGQYPLDQDVTLQEARRHQWIRLTDAARESFLCPDIPGAAFIDDDGNNKNRPEKKHEDDAQEAAGGTDAAATGDDIVPPPPDNFLLMLLLPKHVDYVKLGKGNYRQVDERNETEGTWSSQRVNP